ncbi:hypothetical protein M514_10713 [Trichuris suis]|uniref:Uncharacterized protein n=1 Tax=Trichuris suis TaxID=68888 RepID=A0A085LTW7_9BILA|nr:hypothetical protein M513_10713 [Trichuris suis]KFD62445.1 hypothetical protein M514_10713 [Trichuris suis]
MSNFSCAQRLSASSAKTIGLSAIKGRLFNVLTFRQTFPKVVRSERSMGSGHFVHYLTWRQVSTCFAPPCWPFKHASMDDRPPVGPEGARQILKRERVAKYAL